MILYIDKASCGLFYYNFRNTGEAWVCWGLLAGGAACVSRGPFSGATHFSIGVESGSSGKERQKKQAN
jgi:hypothetical protein